MKANLFKNLSKIALIACALGAPLPAQTISSVRIFTEPAGELQYYVDGQFYSGPANLFWPAGSRHTLSVTLPVQSGLRPKTRYLFGRWADSTDLLKTAGAEITVTADPRITYYKAIFSVQYALSLNFFSCPDPSSCNSPGTVFVNGAPFTSNADVYFEAGGSVALQASPNPGYVFAGWLQGPGTTSQAFLTSVVLSGPLTVYPRFEPARAVQILSSPPGLQVLADRTPVTAPTTLEWGANTTHTIGGISPQTDTHGVTWVFDSWSDGGSLIRDYTVPQGSMPLSITANYVPAIRVTFLTNPTGLKLNVDGRDNWPGYNFWWAAGEKHTVSAPAQQTDAQGRPYVFRAWSNAGPATQEVTVSPDDSGGMRVIANYEMLGRISLQSSPTGIPIQVDGETCPTPCVVDRAIGTQVRVSTAATVPAGEGSRLDFQGWTDSGSLERMLTAGADPQKLTASYRLMYRLNTSCDPPGGVNWRTQPDSADGYYEAQTQVAVTAEPKSGYRFRQWAGDLSGLSRSGVLNMTAPRQIRALLDRVPYIAPAGVKNAAGETPQDAVAPGSIISIYGASLTDGVALGPESPLAQTLGGVTVRSAGRLLPLFFVSPEQINAQLPSDLPEGPQNLTVRWEGHSEVAANFTVARNAPGLFGRPIDDRMFAAATHEDGSPISPDSPAHKGEVVTILGTGFGPYLQQAPDGFVLPESVNFRLADRIELVIGDSSPEPLYAGAASGRVGVNAVRFRIGQELPSATSVELKVRINGRESNTVLLPVE
jgi:uncharacterized protein (TIGR03437 family)